MRSRSVCLSRSDLFRLAQRPHGPSALLRPAGLLLFSAAQRYSRVLFLAHSRVAGLSGDFRVSAIVNNAGVSMGVLTFLRDSDLISSGNMPEVELLDLLATLFF